MEDENPGPHRRVDQGIRGDRQRVCFPSNLIRRGFAPVTVAHRKVGTASTTCFRIITAMSAMKSVAPRIYTSTTFRKVVVVNPVSDQGIEYFVMTCLPVIPARCEANVAASFRLNGR